MMFTAKIPLLVHQVARDPESPLLETIESGEFALLLKWCMVSLGDRPHQPSDQFTSDYFDFVTVGRSPVGFGVIRYKVKCVHRNRVSILDDQLVSSLYEPALAEDHLGMVLIATNCYFNPALIYEEPWRGRGIVGFLDRTRVVAMVRDVGRVQGADGLREAARLLNLDSIEIGRIALHPGKKLDLSIVNSRALGLTEVHRNALGKVEFLPFDLVNEVLMNPAVLQRVDPFHFEHFIAELLSGIGFNNVLVTPRSRDGGKDIIASRVVSGLPLTFFFECKQYAQSNLVQISSLRSLLGTLAYEPGVANMGVLVTTSRFTRGACEMIASDCRLDGKDLSGIFGWVLEYHKRWS